MVSELWRSWGFRLPPSPCLAIVSCRNLLPELASLSFELSVLLRRFRSIDRGTSWSICYCSWSALLNSAIGVSWWCSWCCVDACCRIVDVNCVWSWRLHQTLDLKILVLILKMRISTSDEFQCFELCIYEVNSSNFLFWEMEVLNMVETHGFTGLLDGSIRSPPKTKCVLMPNGSVNDVPTTCMNHGRSLIVSSKDG